MKSKSGREQRKKEDIIEMFQIEKESFFIDFLVVPLSVYNSSSAPALVLALLPLHTSCS